MQISRRAPSQENGVNSALISPSKEKRKVEMLSDRVHITPYIRYFIKGSIGTLIYFNFCMQCCADPSLLHCLWLPQ